MRAFGVFLILPGLLAADVLVLKDGSRISGRVADKGTYVEVATDQGLRSWLKEEVEKILTSPAELLGDSDRLLDEAKADYDRIVALPLGEQSAAAKAALEKLGRARTAVAGARELFPEERYADLDVKLMRVLQLTRLLRDRVGSSFARPGSGDVINGPPPMPVAEAVAIFVDAKRRADPAQAEPARKTLLRLRAERADQRELATAAAVTLSRPEWATSRLLDEYLAKPWGRELGTSTPAAHLEAALWAAERTAAIRKADPAGAVEPLALLGAGHLAHAPAGPEADKAARGLGLVALNGTWGTPEGHAVRDLDAWIASGDFDLAVLAFVKEHRAADTPATRYVWSYALLRLAQAKRKGFDRPVSGLLGIKGAAGGVADHVAALVKSIKAAAVCGGCSGEGKLRCVNCFGRKEVRFNCEKCMGSGKVQPPGAGGLKSRMAEPIPCYPCRGRGFTKLIKCEKCPDGTVDCKQCEAPKDPPSMDDIAKAAACGTCEGRGTLFRTIAWACPACLGLGQKLAPKAEPSKVLP